MWAYFTDPVLRAPILGCMLMAISASLVGALAFVRGRSLLGETLSHAAYPGVVIAVALGGLAFSGTLVIAGGLIFALLGLCLIKALEERCRIPVDAALTFVLALFFGIGVTLASHIQFVYPSASRQVESLLYGQVATMTDLHLLLYGVLALVVLLTILLFYRPLQLAAFDPQFAKSAGVSLKIVDILLLTLIALSVVVGIRSVGVVLISSMLIAPPVAARPLSRRLSTLLFLSALSGMLAAFVGSLLSVTLSRTGLPTGPMIVLTGAGFALLSLLFAPGSGLILRLIRKARFSFQCREEHLLKALWKGGVLPKGGMPLRKLKREGWVEKRAGQLLLTGEGKRRAARIVRLHRLWEVYLVDQLGVGPERVHRSAEEMEHILTPELEKRLDTLLQHPTTDPHESPIPPGGV